MSESSQAPAPTLEPRAGPSLARRIALSLALLVVIAGLLSAGILALHVRVTASLETTREDGLAAQEALGLALALREHYLHETHTVIQGDSAQVAHHHHWIDDIERRVDSLLPRVPSAQRDALVELRETSRQIDELYRRQLLPAALAGDRETVRTHQHNSEALLRRATTAADAVVAALDERSATTSREALELSRLAIVVGVVGVVLLGLAAASIALRLRRSVLSPLARLSAAARRFGAGEFDFRVGDEGLDTTELAALGGALNTMAVELEARELELLQAERVAAIGQLTAGIAHEINNPIAVIRGYIKTMLPGLSTAQAELREELEIIDEEAAACQRLVEDLLTYAREPALERREVEIRALVNDAIRRATSAATAPEPERPRFEAQVTEQHLALDPRRLHQVLANLLRNASEASDPGATIELRGTSEGQHYRLEVLDRGPGIAAELRERVFEPFFSARRGGSGLGLAVSRGLIEAHGGRIYAAEPGAGVGARMVVELPLRPEPEAQP